MADFIKVEIKGMNKLLSKMGNMRKDVEDILEGDIEEGANRVELFAKEGAPDVIKTAHGIDDKDEPGQIRNSIRTVKVSKLRCDVEVGIPGKIGDLAAWVEFGTGKYIDIPPGFEEYAMNFIGKIRPGTGTILAQPYLFPALERERKVFIERLKKDLNAL